MTTNGMLNMVYKLKYMFYKQQNHCGTSCNAIKCWKWDVSHLTSIHKGVNHKYAVIILNRPITQNEEFISNFWNNATVRMTVDGGTNRWDKYVTSMSSDVRKTIKIPDMVTGDFDSLSEEILEKYKQKGCKIVHTPDQDHTDFTKALMELKIYCQQHTIEIDHVIAFAQSSGRLDQILGNIQTLFLAKQKSLLNTNTRLYLLADDSLSWLLNPGEHVITIPEEIRKHKAWCSLVPIGETCQSVTSLGLKWNLENQQLKFGELVSTSNTFDGSELVKIKCSNTVLWSMKVPSLAGP